MFEWIQDTAHPPTPSNLTYYLTWAHGRPNVGGRRRRPCQRRGPLARRRTAACAPCAKPALPKGVGAHTEDATALCIVCGVFAGGGGTMMMASPSYPHTISDHSPQYTCTNLLPPPSTPRSTPPARHAPSRARETPAGTAEHPPDSTAPPTRARDCRAAASSPDVRVWALYVHWGLAG